MESLLLPLIVALPALGALLLLLVPKDSQRGSQGVALSVTALVAALAWALGFTAEVGEGVSRFYSAPWIPSLGIEFLLGVDGVSLPLVVLTASLTLLAVVASLAPREWPRGYFALLLLLETGMLGVFLALDFVLFYVFWELILVPMYLLIALWGGENRRHAAFKYFVYTLVGSVLMLGAGLLLYGASDLTRLEPDALVACGVVEGVGSAQLTGEERLATWLASDGPMAERFLDAEATGRPLRTFNLLALAGLGQSTDAFTAPAWGGKNLAWWAFVLLVIGLAVKLPAAPLHTWLPDAHTEAPTPVSMLLAGVMLKLGGYGLVRIAWPCCPAAAVELAAPLATLGVVSLFWGALAALAQNDFKRLVAYSSVSHMGYVLLGLAAGTAGQSAWSLGATGAVFQMVAHGVTSAGLFFAVGVVYDRVHHRDLDRLGGLMNLQPTASGLGLVLVLASLGLPGLCGFVGEFLVMLAAWEFWPWLAAVAAGATVLTAAYLLRAARLAYYGPEYRGPHAEELTPLTQRELFVLAPLVAAALVLGIRPGIVTDHCQPPLAAMAPAFVNPLKAPNQAVAERAPAADAPSARRTTR